jgi:hypothetical protein
VIEAIERFLHTLRSRALEAERHPAPADVAELEDAIT